MSPPKKSRRSCALISLGCPKNLVDSERMAGLLHSAGYRILSQPERAELVLINTCGFIADARAESHEAIQQVLDLKRQGQVRYVVVAGCLAQRDKQQLLDRYPEIDRVVGVFARDEILNAVHSLYDGRSRPELLIQPPPSCLPPDTERHRLTLPHLAYLKIAEGCNRLCSFCSIPSIRGPYVSKPIEQAVTEAEQLAADGVRELVLVAQDTTYYGLDLYGRPRLSDLLHRLETVDGLAWIRLMYLYPQHISDELIETFCGGSKILPYLDLPLQHVNDEVLRRMRRAVDRRQTEQLLDWLRERIDALVLRTTLMVGFPGETDAQFEELLDFVRQRRFERLGVFGFCAEPGTPAAELDGQLPPQIITARRDRLLELQQQIAFEWNATQVGKTIEVIVDRTDPAQPDLSAARSRADAPEIDAQVYVTGRGLKPGQIVACEVVAAEGYDLIGVVD